MVPPDSSMAEQTKSSGFLCQLFSFLQLVYLLHKMEGERKGTRGGVYKRMEVLEIGDGGCPPKCGHFYGSHNWPQSSKSCRFAPERFTRKRRINMLASS